MQRSDRAGCSFPLRGVALRGRAEDMAKDLKQRVMRGESPKQAPAGDETTERGPPASNGTRPWILSQEHETRPSLVTSSSRTLPSWKSTQCPRGLTSKLTFHRPSLPFSQTHSTAFSLIQPDWKSRLDRDADAGLIRTITGPSSCVTRWECGRSPRTTSIWSSCCRDVDFIPTKGLFGTASADSGRLTLQGKISRVN